MATDLCGKVALITGGSRGIGRATAVRLAGMGAQVVIGYSRDDAAAEAALDEVKAAGGAAHLIRFDVADPKACKNAVSLIVEQHKGLHILINNAGMTLDALVMRVSDADWQRCLAVNLSSVLYLCRAASRPMIRQRSGAIVNVASVVAQSGNAGQAAYSAAKGGVISLTRSLARELGKKSVRVNAVSPGLIETDMTSLVSKEKRADALSLVPLGRAGGPREVANAIAFLASDESSYITGHVLDVNGGIHM